MDWAEAILHPARLRVLQTLRAAGESTAKEIAEAMGDVPRATVYRHVKTLEEAGAIEVARTRRVRGATEKTYVLSRRALRPESDDARGLSAALHLESMGAMDEYLSRKDADPDADRVLLQSARIWATDDEYDELLERVGEAVSTCIANLPREGRRRRTLNLISLPPTEAEEGDR